MQQVVEYQLFHLLVLQELQLELQVHALLYVFLFLKGIPKILLKIARSKKKRHDGILMLAKSKLNSIEKLMSKALSDVEISHEEFIMILDEKDRYEKMKYKLESDMREKNKIIRLRSMHKFKK